MKDGTINVSFRDAVFEKGYIWIFDNLLQAICRIELEKFRMEVISYYTAKEKFDVRKIFLYKDKFYLVSEDSVDILIYDKTDKENRYQSAFYLQKSDVFKESKEHVTFKYGDCIYFFHRYLDKEVICFDLATKKYSQKNFFEDLIKEMKSKNRLFGKNFRYSKGEVWFVLKGTKFYGTCNLDNKKAELFQAEDGFVLNSCCYDDEHIWLVEAAGGEVICDGQQRIQLPEKQPDSRLYSIDKWICIFSKGSDKLYFIEKATLRTLVLELPLIENGKQNVVQEIYQYGDSIFLLYIGALLVLDKNTLTIKCVNIKCENYVEKCFSIERVMLEEDRKINLGHLLQYCHQSKDFAYRREKAKNEMGQVIWNAIGRA